MGGSVILPSPTTVYTVALCYAVRDGRLGARTHVRVASRLCKADGVPAERRTYCLGRGMAAASLVGDVGSVRSVLKACLAELSDSSDRTLFWKGVARGKGAASMWKAHDLVEAAAPPGLVAAMLAAAVREQAWNAVALMVSNLGRALPDRQRIGALSKNNSEPPGSLVLLALDGVTPDDLTSSQRRWVFKQAGFRSLLSLGHRLRHPRGWAGWSADKRQRLWEEAVRRVEWRAKLDPSSRRGTLQWCTAIEDEAQPRCFGACVSSGFVPHMA